ncbi:hypothetical protein ACFL4W_00575 [Planctomycetota bacterium]
MAISEKDREILRELAGEIAEIAALPEQQETIRLWKALNARRPERPMITIDQVCWNEMEFDNELALQCTDPECRGYEDSLRRTLYQWKHFPADMVVEPFLRVPKAVHNTGFGIGVDEQVAVTDATNAVKGHKYNNQFETEADLDKLCVPQISHDAAETERRLAVAGELFEGLLEPRAWGYDPHLSLWDPISTWMGVEGALYALIDRPDFVHRLVGRMTDGYLSMLDQLETQGLLCQPQSLVHCTGAFTDELPADGYDPERPRTKDLWMYGLAQMFATVSPAMFKEFEVDYISRICTRFGLVYYGCCDPLDLKMDEVRMIPNVRKISMSPWVEQPRGAAAIGGDYVFSRKPNPAQLAWDRWDPDAVEKDLSETMAVCAEHGCPLEFILKDISTVRYEPQRLWEWSYIAKRVATS